MFKVIGIIFLLMFMLAGRGIVYAEDIVFDFEQGNEDWKIPGWAYEQGDHVAIWATNVPEWYQLQLATARMGCRLITVNPEWKKEEIRYALRQSDTNVLVMLRGFVKQGKSRSREYNYLEIIRDIVPELKSSGSDEALKLESFPELRRIVLISDTKEQGMILWSELLDNPGEEYPSVDDPGIRQT